MSGVQGYVKQVGKGTDFQTSGVGQERLAHKNQMKVSLRSTRVNQTPSRAPSAHDYNNYGPSIPNQGYHAGKFYDSSADSEFDETRSDLTVGKADMLYRETEDNDTVHQDLGFDENAQFGSLNQQNKALNEHPAPVFRSGRFQKPQNAHNQAQSQIYTAHQGEPQNGHLRVGAEAVDNAARKVVDDFGNSFDDESGDEYTESASNGGSSNDNSSQVKRPAHGRLDNDGPESDAPVASQSRLSKAQVQANASISSDYAEQELHAMDFSQLQAESWETVPKAPDLVLPDKLQASNVTLENKIDFYSQMAFEQSKNGKGEEIEGDEPYAAQARFFASLSAEDWDTAGDYLIGKFTEIMQKLKAAKQDKRRVMMEFEAEIAAREAKVRQQSLNIDKKLGDMESNGKELLGGNLSSS